MLAWLACCEGAAADDAVPTAVHYFPELIVAGSVDGDPGSGTSYGIGNVLAASSYSDQVHPSAMAPPSLRFTASGLSLSFEAFTFTATETVTVATTVHVPAIGGGTIPISVEFSSYSASIPAVAGTVIQNPGESFKRLSAPLPDVTFTESFGYQIRSGPQILAAGNSIPHAVHSPDYEILTYDDQFPRLRFLNTAGNDEQPFQLLGTFSGSVTGHDLAVTFHARVRHAVYSDTGAQPTTTSTVTSTTTTTSLPLCSDLDGDGVPDAVDRCAGTPSGAGVDDGGCSRAQFCARSDARTRDGVRACKRTDWKNDEPLMRRGAQDCMVDRGAGGDPSDDRCVPAALSGE